MSLDTDDRLDPNQAPTRQEIAEYDKLLAQLKVDELRAAAQRWGVRLREARKTSIVQQLATWLSDPNVIRARIAELDDLGLQVLTYLHLALSPDYGIVADGIVQGMARYRASVQQRARDADLQPIDTSPAFGESPQANPGPLQEHGEAIRNRIALLRQQGLLLPFRQSSVEYCVLPAAVRRCLPSQPQFLVDDRPADSMAAMPTIVHEISIGQGIQALFAIWTTIAEGLPGKGEPLSRQALPPRRPIEGSWATLQDWNNDPDEISDIEVGRFGSSRTGARRPERYSGATLNWAMTVRAPPRRLSDDDLAFVSRQTGRPAPEIEFGYVLLEALGALSGDPGQPVSVHKEAMYHFLRAFPAAKVQALWQAWTASETWSEMEGVLRSTAPDTPHLRLRRSLAQLNFKPAHLYAEWRIARQTVLRFLSLLDEERWTPVDSFLRTIHAIHPDLLHYQTDSSIWWLESPKTGKQFGTTLEDWQQGHGRFVMAMLQGPLYWLGLIRLGYSSDASPDPQALQLAPAGALALGKRTTLSPDGAGMERATEGSDPERSDPERSKGTACSISDDLTITLLPGLAPVELYDMVHAVGSLIEATPEQFVYRLRATRVLSWAEAAASQGGASPRVDDAIETLIATLSRHCTAPGAPRTQGQPVATSWQRKLRAWGRNYGQLHVYENLTLIELADEYALQELLVSTSLREHVVYQFSPRLVAIQDDAVDELVQEMERRGYTPRVK